MIFIFYVDQTHSRLVQALSLKRCFNSVRMKKIVLLLVMLGGILPVNISTAFGQENWVQPSKPYWQGKTDTIAYWYTIDAEGRLAWTTDTEKWTIAPQSLWWDAEGHLYRIKGSDLMMSPDTGSTWVKATSRYWRGSDGMWYGFDDNWTLWTGGVGNEPPMAAVGQTPYGGTDSYSGVNVNGETTGINGNGNTKAGIENNSLVTPGASNANSGGTRSQAQYNNESHTMHNTGTTNTGGVVPK